MSASPHQAEPAQPGPLGFALPVFWAAAWVLAQSQPGPALLLAAMVSVLLLLGSDLAGTSAYLLSWGVAAIAGLLLEDFRPGLPDLLTRWAEGAGLDADRIFLSLHNPQVRPAFLAAGSLAAGLLGATAVHATLARGWTTRRHWLIALGVLLTTWCVALAVTRATGQPYGMDHHLLAVQSKNAAATLTALAVTLALGLAWHAWHQRESWLIASWLAVAGFACHTLAGLQSWTGVVGALAGGVALPLLATRGRPTSFSGWLWLITGAAGLLVLVTSLSPVLATRLTDLPHDFRLGIWRDTLRLLATAPLAGTGLGSFEGLYPLVATLALPANARLTHPDSSWVLLLVEWGPLAALAATFGVFWLLRGVRRAAAKRDQTRAQRAEQISLATAGAAVVAWLACGVSDIALHRTETVMVGAVLLALLPPLAPLEAPPAWRVWVGLTAGLALAAMAALAERPHIRDDLRWQPLSPTLHYRAGLTAWNRDHDQPRALAHFRAAVQLDHHSLELPRLAARQLTGPCPAEAAGFWRDALARAGEDTGLALSLLQSALREFPAQPATYWEEIAAQGRPDLLLVLAARDGADADRLLRRWLDAGHSGSLQHPVLRAAFFNALDRAAEGPGLLQEILDWAPAGLPREFFIAAATRLHRAGRDQQAMAVLRGVTPYSALPATGEPTLIDAPNRRWLELLHGLPGSGSPARLRLLENICGLPASSPWFRLQLARELHESGRTAEAVQRLLEGASDQPKG